jgi:hypothetical protein
MSGKNTRVDVMILDGNLDYWHERSKTTQREPVSFVAR